MSGEVLLQATVQGLQMGAIYALIALSMTLIFSVGGLLNFAHGDFMALAMYGALALYQSFALDAYAAAPLLFFGFRLMVACGFILAALFAVSLWHTTRETGAPRWLFRLALLAMPLPWIAIEVGWFVAEFGRQPWIIDGVLPTFLATSELGVFNLVLTIAGFTLLYGALAVIEVRLMLAAIRKGPEVAAVVDGFGPSAAQPQPAE